MRARLCPPRLRRIAEVQAEGGQRAGFSKADGAMMYSGNWNRDMNQLLVPAVIAAKEQLQISCGPAIYSATVCTVSAAPKLWKPPVSV